MIFTVRIRVTGGIIEVEAANVQRKETSNEDRSKDSTTYRIKLVRHGATEAVLFYFEFVRTAAKGRILSNSPSSLFVTQVRNARKTLPRASRPLFMSYHD